MSSLAVKTLVGRRDALPNLPNGRVLLSEVDRLEQDRLRISQELHDDLGQRLALLGIQLDALENNCACPQTMKGLQSIREQVWELDRDMHRICCRLYPVLLEKLGLVVALKSLCRDFSQSGISAEFYYENCPATVPDSISLCLYRVVQEALNNVSKHARTKQAWVSLRGSAGCIELTVEDSGAGFDLRTLTTKAGLGLTSIQDRVRSAGGKSFISSAPGVGTEIRAMFCTAFVE